MPILATDLICSCGCKRLVLVSETKSQETCECCLCKGLTKVPKTSEGVNEKA